MQQTSHLCTLIPKEQCTKTFRLQHVIFSLHKQTPSLVKMTGRISCHYWMLILWVTRSKSSYCLCLNKECLCGKNLSPVIPLNNQSGLNVSAVEQLQHLLSGRSRHVTFRSRNLLIKLSFTSYQWFKLINFIVLNRDSQCLDQVAKEK